MATLSTHVLDTAKGLPARDLPVSLDARDGAHWRALGAGRTDADGRLKELSPVPLKPGVYRLTFDTGAYFDSCGAECFYPFVQVVFEIVEDRHHHVPLLLSPFGYSTYRGS